MRFSRIIGWDIFRIVLMLIVFAYHANIHLSITFSMATDFFSVGALCMTGFFMLSGSVLFYTHADEDFNRNSILSFYLRRVFSIYPLYIAVLVIFMLYNGFALSDLIMLPVELLGIQSTFLGSFNYSFNGGAWFVSCLLFCYLIFPLIRFLICNMKTKSLIILCVILSVFDIYSQWLCGYLSFGEFYSTPFIRCIQFSLGCIIGALIRKNVIKMKSITAIIGFSSSFLILFVVTKYLVKLGWGNGFPYLQRMAIFDIAAIPCFLFANIFAGCIVIDKSKIVTEISNLSYSFFLAQLFIWKPAEVLFDYFGIMRNIYKIFVCLVLCAIVSIVFHYLIEKPLKTLLLNKYGKRQTVRLTSN